MPQFSCPKCGAALAVDPGTQIAKCQFCGTVTYVDRSEALFYYLLPFTIDEVKAKGIFKRWTAGPAMAKELENGCKITKIVKEFFPVFRFRRSVNKSEKVFVRPARGTTLPGMHNLENMCRMSQKEGITVVLSGVNAKVENVLRRNNFEELLGSENICNHIDLALARAREIVE